MFSRGGRWKGRDWVVRGGGHVSTVVVGSNFLLLQMPFCYLNAVTNCCSTGWIRLKKIIQWSVRRREIINIWDGWIIIYFIYILLPFYHHHILHSSHFCLSDEGEGRMDQKEEKNS